MVTRDIETKLASETIKIESSLSLCLRYQVKYTTLNNTHITTVQYQTTIIIVWYQTVIHTNVNFCTHKVILFSTLEIPSTICTSSCNSQLEDTQYQVCCDPKNYGNFVKVNKENAHVAYLVCPLEPPDWCNIQF